MTVRLWVTRIWCLVNVFLGGIGVLGMVAILREYGSEDFKIQIFLGVFQWLALAICALVSLFSRGYLWGLVAIYGYIILQSFFLTPQPWWWHAVNVLIFVVAGAVAYWNHGATKAVSRFEEFD